LMTLQNARRDELSLGGPDMAGIEEETVAAKFDLTLNLTESEEGIRGVVEYSLDLFEATTIRRMARHYEQLVEEVIRNADQRIGGISLMEEAERRQIIEEWNRTQAEYGRDGCIHQIFQEQVERSPDAIAVIYEDCQHSYAELNGRANRLAHHLLRLGVGPESVVGICMERSVEMIVGLIGILKAGATYLPLDPAYPVERLRYMLEDSEALVVLTQERSSGALPEFAGKTVCLDRDWFVIGVESEENPPLLVAGRNLAYVIYTSGSTGQPKGVCIPHYAINRLVRETNYTRISPGDFIAHASTPTFDAATFEIWGALLNGATVRILSRDEVLDPAAFAQQLRERSFNILFLTTALFNRYAQMDASVFSSLDYLLFGGEAVDPRWVRAVLQSGRPRHLLHVYGPTESTTFATWHEVRQVEEGALTVPIGRPLTNTQAYLLDEQGELCPIGIPGELYLGGDGLAHGYLKRPELTAERFIEGAAGMGRLYQTGDICRWRSDGVLEFLGRRDHQVKIRGFRIELGEIEAVLNKHESVRESAVLVREDVIGDRQLIGYAVCEEGVTSERLKKHIRERLPEYMIPSAIMLLEQMPLTSNGKLDRRALPVPDVVGATREYEAPVGATEIALAQIWAELLKLERVGRHDNFFELGGHSLLVVRLIERMRREGLHTDVRALFTTPTLAELAAATEDMEILL
jgi:amino acid adenylation domain-containing protein